MPEQVVSCRGVQLRHNPWRHSTCDALRRMVSFLVVGPQMIRSEVCAIDHGAAYRLSLSHPHGVIVEYFKTAAAAIVRQQEIEALFLGAPKETNA